MHTGHDRSQTLHFELLRLMQYSLHVLFPRSLSPDLVRIAPPDRAESVHGDGAPSSGHRKTKTAEYPRQSAFMAAELVVGGMMNGAGSTTEEHVHIDVKYVEKPGKSLDSSQSGWIGSFLSVIGAVLWAPDLMTCWTRQRRRGIPPRFSQETSVGWEGYCMSCWQTIRAAKCCGW